MSVEAIAWARKVPGLTPTIKLLLMLLADHSSQHPSHGESFVCWPKQDLLADDAGVSRRTVIRALSEMEERGLITRQRQHRDDGYRRADLYFLHVGSQGAKLAQSGNRGAPNVTPVTDLGDTGDHSYVTPVSQQEPSVEPSGTHSPAPQGDGGEDDPRLQFSLMNPPVPTDGKEGDPLRAYLDWRKGLGMALPPSRTIKRLGVIVKDARDSGVPIDTIKRALMKWHDEGRSPESLTSFIDTTIRKPKSRAQAREEWSPTAPDDNQWGWSADRHTENFK